MIERRIIEWLDLGESVQLVDVYQKKKLLYFFKYHHSLVKHGIVSEVADIIFHFIFFLQIISLSSVNIEPNNDEILEILKYLEEIIIPHKILTNSKTYLTSSAIIWGINLVHLILSTIVFVLLQRKIIVKILFFFISIINFIIYYYLIGPIVYLALSGTFCSNGIHEILNVNCYSNSTHLLLLILNFIFGLYSLIIIETFSLYNNQIGNINGSNIKSRVSCNYDIFSSNAKLLVYIIVYFYKIYANDKGIIFKYIYQIYIFLSCFILSIYTINTVFYYNRSINILIHFSWLFDTWFALCMLLKIFFSINDITLFILFGLILIIIVFAYQNNYSYYNRITQLDLLNVKSLVYIEKFNYEFINLYNSTNKTDKLLLNGIIKKFENYIVSNPELNEIYNKIKNDIHLRKKFYSLNELSMFALIFTIYNYYLEKSEIKSEIILHFCYFLINKLKNTTYAIFLISKLKNNSHIQLYHKFVLMEKIKDYLIFKLNKKSFKNSINNVQIGSVILYYQYLDLFKLKIYEATSNQIEYFDTLRNNVSTGKVTQNFLETGENIITLRNEIFKIWEKIVQLNPFSNEILNDYMLYLKTILQDDNTAKFEEKKFKLIKSNKLSEKNNIYHSMFKNDINSVLLVDGYTNNGKILYATPNFPFLYRFNGKEIINTPIEELLPNVIQPFHKDLMDNILKYSNINNIFNKDFDVYLKGKNNALFYVNIFIKPVPNLAYGLIYFVLLTKIQDHEFTIILDKDFKIDGFTEMNQGNNFTLNNNSSNNYNLSLQAITHHIGKIIPEILIEICYKDNIFSMKKNDIDIKGNLYSINNLKDAEIERNINILIDIIKKKGSLNISENTEESRKMLYQYNELQEIITEKKNNSYSIFFKVDTRKFLDGKYRYHRLYVTTDNLYLIETKNFFNNKTMNVNMTLSELGEDKKIIQDKLGTMGTFNNDNEEDTTKIGGDFNLKRASKQINNNYGRYLGNNLVNKANKANNKCIQLKVPVNNKILNNENEEHKNDENNNINVAEESYIQNENNELFDFTRLKNSILNKKDSIQITVMKLVSLLFVIIVIILVIYDYIFLKDLYSNLVEYLYENLYFTHSKIITSCIYISSVNIKWLKYKYIGEYSCPINCTSFYLKSLDKCIKNLNNQKEKLYSYDSDFHEIILVRKNLSLIVYNSDKQDILNVDVNDYLNLIISQGVKLIGSFNDYHNNYGRDRINMENLLRLSFNFCNSKISGITGNEKTIRVNQKFKNNYIRIIIGVILCLFLLGTFSYYIIDFNKIELFFLDKLINFSSPNFENYLKNLEDLKKKLKNTKTEEDENNLDDIDYEMGSIDGDDSKINSKGKDDRKKGKNIKEQKDKKEKGEKISAKKRSRKQNKIQQQRIKKKKTMSFYFYKQNIFFAIKTSIILICFVSYFAVSFLMYKYYFNNYLKFDSSVNGIENLYYDSFKLFLNFKSELEHFQSNPKYKMTILSAKDIQMPNYGNILNDLIQNDIYRENNTESLRQLYNGDLCLILFYNETTIDYSNCKKFLSSILLKGMEQAIIQMGVMVNNVLDELPLIYNLNDLNETVYGNSSNFKKYELFIEYYLLLSYLKNEEIINNLRIDETHYSTSLALKIIIIYFVIYLILFIFLFYFIFMYKYTYNSLFNFIVVLAAKFISDDEHFYHKIIELEKKLYS